MKKRILFCIGWDVIMAALIYTYYSIEIWIREYKMKNLSLSPIIITRPLLLILIGVLFALLVLTSNKNYVTRKQAVLEFVLIGIPSFYLATIFEISYFVYLVLRLNIPFYSPVSGWLYFNSVTPVIGSVIFGYELVVLVKSLVLFKSINVQESS